MGTSWSSALPSRHGQIKPKTETKKGHPFGGTGSNAAIYKLKLQLLVHSNNVKLAIVRKIQYQISCMHEDAHEIVENGVPEH